MWKTARKTPPQSETEAGRQVAPLIFETPLRIKEKDYVTQQDKSGGCILPLAIDRRALVEQAQLAMTDRWFPVVMLTIVLVLMALWWPSARGVLVVTSIGAGGIWLVHVLCAGKILDFAFQYFRYAPEVDIACFQATPQLRQRQMRVGFLVTVAVGGWWLPLVLMSHTSGPLPDPWGVFAVVHHLLGTQPGDVLNQAIVLLVSIAAVCLLSFVMALPYGLPHYTLFMQCVGIYLFYAEEDQGVLGHWLPPQRARHRRRLFALLWTAYHGLFVWVIAGNVLVVRAVGGFPLRPNKHGIWLYAMAILASLLLVPFVAACQWAPGLRFLHQWTTQHAPR